MLKGEQLGLNLNVANDDNRVLITGIVPNSASNRASDSRGNICPIMLNDEILEINGVALNVIVVTFLKYFELLNSGSRAKMVCSYFSQLFS